LPESRHRRNRRPRNLEIPRTTRRGGTNKFILVGSIVIAILVIGSFAAVPIFQSIGGPGEITFGTAAAHVDGVGTKQEVMRSKNHVDLDNDDGNDVVAYNSAPPTSGDHWSVPQRCGFFTDTVPDEQIVHNLEHSNIVISYNLPNQADVDALRKVFDDMDEGWRAHFTVARPYDEIGVGQVALSAWGVLDIMDGVDQERIQRFFEHYVGRLGPEGAISCRGAQSSMPGTG
jgi:hypothetical protein